jgi:hypothetical protein
LAFGFWLFVLLCGAVRTVIFVNVNIQFVCCVYIAYSKN